VIVYLDATALVKRVSDEPERGAAARAAGFTIVAPWCSLA